MNRCRPWTAGVGAWTNIFIERLSRSLKYEAVYLHEISDGFQAQLPIFAGSPFMTGAARTPCRAPLQPRRTKRKC